MRRLSFDSILAFLSKGHRIARLMRSCAVYFKEDTCYVVARIATDRGNVSKEPMVKLTSEASALEIGQAVLRALDEFEDIDGLPDPNHLEAFLHFVGARSWRGFAKGALHVNVAFDGKEIRLTPSRADGRGAFLYDAQSRNCPRDAERVGGALLELADSY